MVDSVIRIKKIATVDDLVNMSFSPKEIATSEEIQPTLHSSKLLSDTNCSENATLLSVHLGFQWPSKFLHKQLSALSKRLSDALSCICKEMRKGDLTSLLRYL